MAMHTKQGFVAGACKLHIAKATVFKTNIVELISNDKSALPNGESLDSSTD
jgi:hypothetical protein